MEKVFLIKRKSARHVAIDIQIPPHEALIDTYLKHMYASNTTVIVAHKSKVPNRVWKNAFVDFDDEGNIEISMSTAKQIFMQQLRFKRNRTLLKLDKNYCEAYDNKDNVKMNQIEEKKKFLRDLPSTINVDSHFATIADLEKIWPTDILGVIGEI